MNRRKGPYFIPSNMPSTGTPPKRPMPQRIRDRLGGTGLQQMDMPLTIDGANPINGFVTSTNDILDLYLDTGFPFPECHGLPDWLINQWGGQKPQRPGYVIINESGTKILLRETCPGEAPAPNHLRHVCGKHMLDQWYGIVITNDGKKYFAPSVGYMSSSGWYPVEPRCGD